MLIIHCGECGKEINEKAALILGPPDDKGYVKKDHLCVPCWELKGHLQALDAATTEVVEAAGALNEVWESIDGKITEEPDKIRAALAVQAAALANYERVKAEIVSKLRE